jgi:hypothetical protein
MGRRHRQPDAASPASITSRNILQHNAHGGISLPQSLAGLVIGRNVNDDSHGTALSALTDISADPEFVAPAGGGRRPGARGPPTTTFTSRGSLGRRCRSATAELGITGSAVAGV